jgi:hypothetical protein
VSLVVEKKFYLESGSELQEIGLRAQIISFLMANGITDGNAINDATNQKKVIVAIRASDEAQIKEIKKNLVKHLNNLHTSSEFCYKNFPNDISASDLLELNNPHSVIILPLNTLANSLMLEQTSKGVGAMKLLAERLEPLSDLPAKLKPLDKLSDLPQIMEKLIAKLD